MSGSVYALVGGVGGAGTTRLSLEFAATLARAERRVAVVDAAFATQGLATATPGPVDVDVTDVVTADRPLADATVELSLDVPGRVAVAPARAPFERLARAKTSECARRLADRLSTANDQYDAVVVDVPPVAANQSVAAVTAADHVTVVVPDTPRGEDALARTRDRLVDVDAAVDAVVANFADPDDPSLPDADAVVPESETTELGAAPVALDTDPFPTAVAAAVETVVGVDLNLPEPEPSSLAEYLPG